ncbi:HD domain-containing protein [Vibrio sp. JPW-9-11-11]|uniref:HD-GYP domain-containing protein n=1 Tax=Vibrio sp. JPW-9-11-11 TaxID=1416532 RepID=UPI0015948DF0|nr:HD domain-containing phosphohydrolase [Vibrio sp. JPW-9-11-11]NVD05653.1 HD domain-containing protein [Vibrio sp. JPW-9-11-11]
MEATIDCMAFQPPCHHQLNHKFAAIQQRMQVHHATIDRVCFVLYDPCDHLLKTYADSAQQCLSGVHIQAPISGLPALKPCLESRRHAVFSDLRELRSCSLIQRFLEQGYHSSLVWPVFSAKQFLGFIFALSSQVDAFEERDLTHLAPYLNMLQSTVLSEFELVSALLTKAHSLVARSPIYQRESSAHKQRMAAYCELMALGLAERYDFDDEWIEHLSLFAQFHDIGKVMLPPELLCKQEQLTRDEVVQLQRHIEHGEQLLEEFAHQLGESEHPAVKLFGQVIAHHYEFLDGSGYPRQLKGEQIPISSRIVCVANIFDALTSHKPYKQAWSIPYAMIELGKMVAEGKLDGECVNVLRENQTALKAIVERYPERDPKDGGYERQKA